jgi:hypothetical protein
MVRWRDWHGKLPNDDLNQSLIKTLFGSIHKFGYHGENFIPNASTCRWAMVWQCWPACLIHSIAAAT